MTTSKTGLAEHLQRHILIGDGAMGTQLYRLGLPVGICYEELCVSKPDVVASVHASYYQAGARLIETNTFGANRAGLARYSLEDEVDAINRAAVRVARDAVGSDAYVVGTIGSVTGVRRHLEPPVDLELAYREQASALLSEQPDGILLETFLDLEELLLATRVIRELMDVPVLAQLALIELTVTRDGYPLADALDRLTQAGAAVVGLNCRFGPADIARAFRRADLDPSLLLSAYPNAGLLSVTDGHYDYPSEPAYFADAAEAFWQLGVRVIGGCCGTTPDHIRAMAERLAGRAPHPIPTSDDKQTEASSATASRPSIVSPALQVTSTSLTPSAGVSMVPIPPSSLRIHEKVRTEYTVIVELDPPKELSATEFMQGARALRDAGVDAVTLADNSLAVMRMSNMALGALMKQEGIEPLLHISCRDRNLIGQQSHLMGLHALDIRQILVITGDPSRFGDFPGATSVFDVSSFDMLKMVKQLNDGLAFSGRALAERASFSVGAALNPHVRHLDKAIKRMERKVEAGADYIMTQPIYDPRMFETLHEATRHVGVPIFVGIMPLVSSRNAEFLHNEVPGITLSDEARHRMSLYKGARAREEGLAMARELIDAAMDHFNGIYLITPMMRYEMTVSLTQYVKERAASAQSRRGVAH